MTQACAAAASCWASKPKRTKRLKGSKRCLKTSAQSPFAPNNKSSEAHFIGRRKRASDKFALHRLLLICQFNAHFHERCFVEGTGDLKSFRFLILLQAGTRVAAELAGLLA